MRPAGSPRAITHPKVLVGLAILALFLLAGFSQPILHATVWEGEIHIYDPRFGYDFLVAHPSPPSGRHWLGTSSQGRDVLSMLTFATRSTLTVALTAGAMIAAVSLLGGSAAAYRRGWLDGVLTHVSDAMVLLPAMLAVFILGIGRPTDHFGAIQVGLAFGAIYGVGPALATVRAAGLVVMEKPFVEAARMVGGGGVWLVRRHVLPHLVPHAAVQAMIGVTGAVTAEAFLSFRSAVGDDVGFGMMVYDGIVWAEMFAGISPIAWWVMLAGAGGITLLAAAFYSIGVGIREALDPRSRER